MRPEHSSTAARASLPLMSTNPPRSLTDDEIREICHASADGREGVIARIAASRKAADGVVAAALLRA